MVNNVMMDTHEVHIHRGTLINDDPQNDVTMDVISKVILNGMNGNTGWITQVKNTQKPL